MYAIILLLSIASNGYQATWEVYEGKRFETYELCEKWVSENPQILVESGALAYNCDTLKSEN